MGKLTITQDRDRWQNFALALSDELKRRTFMVSGLMSIVAADGRGFADGVLLNSAKTMMGELSPESRAKAEYAYKSACLADLESAPDGTRESLAMVAEMIETWGPECWPANKHGQVDFARAMMESAAAEIRAFLKGQPATTPEQKIAERKVRG